MTDPAQNPQSDPLKALEDALKGSSGSSAASAAPTAQEPSAPEAPATATPQEPPVPAEDEHAKQRAEIEALTAQHDAEDQKELQAHLETLNQFKQQTSEAQPVAADTPAPASDQTSDDDGFAIRQITHQKL